MIALFESTETVEARISASSDPAVFININSAIANIIDNDNDVGDVNVDLTATVSGNEDGLVSIEYTATLSNTNNTQQDITFDLNPGVGSSATLGSDFVDFTGTVITIPDGQISATATVTVLQDTLFENTETVVATLSNPSNPAINITTANATGNILDDDNDPASISTTISATTNGNETGPISVVYTVSIANANNTHGPITVEINPSGGTATVVNDYDDFSSLLVTIPDGASSGTISIPVIDDALFENNETLTAIISNPSDPALNITTANATASIIDNDNVAGSITVSYTHLTLPTKA